MTTNKPRVMLTLDHATYEVISGLAAETDLTIAGIITRLLGAHFAELVEYEEWLKQHPPESPLGKIARSLLPNYGPDDLCAAIRRVDPKYKLLHERIAESQVSSARTLEEILSAPESAESVKPKRKAR